MNQENTSERVANYAATILSMDSRPTELTDELWKQIKSIAASVLTQTPNKEVVKNIGVPPTNPFIGLFGAISPLIKPTLKH